MTPWAQALVVFQKELMDALRDRRAMMSALILPVFGPLVIAAMFTLVAEWTRHDRPLVVAIAHAERAPNLVSYLERNEAKVVPAGDDAEARVRDGTLDFALVVGADYAADFRAGRPAKVELLIDNSRAKTRYTAPRLQRLLRGFSAQLGALRLLARGVSPMLAQPLQIEEIDLATPEKLAATLLGSIPMFLLFGLFSSGMYLAIDATAGERERGSLEPLLINPISRGSIIVGKWMAAVAATWLGITVSLVGFSVALSYVPLQDLGVKLHLGLAELGWLLAILMPLSLFASALQMLLALYARTFKEAQTYLSLVLMVPVLPGMLAALAPIEPRLWMMTIPVLSQTELLSDVMRGQTPRLAWIAVATLSSLVTASAALRAASSLLAKESIIFGRSG